MTSQAAFHMPGAFHADSIYRQAILPTSTTSSSRHHRPAPLESLGQASAPKRRCVGDAATRLDVTPEHSDKLTRHHHPPTTPNRQRASGEDVPSFVNGQAVSHKLDEIRRAEATRKTASGSTKRARDEADAVEHLRQLSPGFRHQAPAHANHHLYGWSNMALSTLGDVMGKVWQFCKAGAFKGFHAGEGPSFEMPPPGHNVIVDHSGHGAVLRDVDSASSILSTPTNLSGEAADRTHATSRVDGYGDVLPGEYQDDKTARHRTPKNQRHGQVSLTAAGNPVSLLSSRAAAPRQASSANVSAPSSPSARPRPASSASLASARSPSPSKVCRTPRGHRRKISSMTPSHPQQPSGRHHRTQSGASTASSRGGAPADMAPPLSPLLGDEARRLAAQRQRDESIADGQISAFNKQLRDMIRQGKEALGTKYEVHGDAGIWEDE